MNQSDKRVTIVAWHGISDVTVFVTMAIDVTFCVRFAVRQEKEQVPHCVWDDRGGGSRDEGREFARRWQPVRQRVIPNFEMSSRTQ